MDEILTVCLVGETIKPIKRWGLFTRGPLRLKLVGTPRFDLNVTRVNHKMGRRIEQATDCGFEEEFAWPPSAWMDGWMGGTEMELPLRPLKHRVLTAGAWSLGGYGLSLALRFGSNLLMTRLLAPQMFGVMAIALMVIAGLNMFSDIGLRLNVVQSNRGHEPLFLNTVWVSQILRGSLLWVFAVAVSATLF